MCGQCPQTTLVWWVQRFVQDHNAETMQAVPTMLELVPHGVNKGSGMRKLLANLELPSEVLTPEHNVTKLILSIVTTIRLLL